MSTFHKPVHRPGDVLETLGGTGDPAELSQLATDSAAALLNRVRETADPAMVEAILAYADTHGIDDVAELWSASPAESLPGALWRLYLLRHVVSESPQEAGYRFRRGLELDSVGQAMAGAGSAPAPGEVVDLANEILRGAFAGDFAGALERAAAFARVLAGGSRDIAAGDASAERAAAEVLHSEGFADLATELAAAARLWRAGSLS